MSVMFLVEVIILIISTLTSLTKADGCGPLGYDAGTLLKPAYWFVNLPPPKCPPLAPFPESTKGNVSSSCRVYFNLCENLLYQCAGTACARFLEYEDFVELLGYARDDPFTELTDYFYADYVGEKIHCQGLTRIRTRFNFHCQKNATWSINITAPHGGSEAPDPDVVFDSGACMYTLNFNYSGACIKIPPNDEPIHNMSNGSIALILFFPGVALYFILGILVNRFRGQQGLDMIPHRKFWLDLPDLIMDGFVFSMATVTCQKHDVPRTKISYEEVH